MRIEGILEKSKKYWAASIPLLLVYTQGKNKKEALAMVKDAVESLVEDSSFKVSVFMGSDGSSFHISANNESQLMAFALRQQRLHHGLSVRDVVTRLGLKSSTAYSRYEKGNIKPDLDKFSKLLQTINEDIKVILKIPKTSNF